MTTEATTWRYLLARERAANGDDYFTVREVYEDHDGRLSWTADAIEPSGETWREIANDLALMSGAANGPVLDLTLDPPALAMPRDLSTPTTGSGA